MRFQIDDLYGDAILVQPVAANGVLPKVHLRFVNAETGEGMQMLLDDRQWAQLKQAGNQSIKESERMG